MSFNSAIAESIADWKKKRFDFRVCIWLFFISALELRQILHEFCLVFCMFLVWVTAKHHKFQFQIA